MEWLYDEMKNWLSCQMYFDKDPVFKSFIENSDKIEILIYGQM